MNPEPPSPSRLSYQISRAVKERAVLGFGLGGLLEFAKLRLARSRAIERALAEGDIGQAALYFAAGADLDRFPARARRRFDAAVTRHTERHGGPDSAATATTSAVATSTEPHLPMPYLVHSALGFQWGSEAWFRDTLHAMTESPLACLAGIAALRGAQGDVRVDPLIVEHASGIERIIEDLGQRTTGPSEALLALARTELGPVVIQSCRTMESYWRNEGRPRDFADDADGLAHWSRCAEQAYRCRALAERWSHAVPSAGRGQQPTSDFAR